MSDTLDGASLRMAGSYDGTSVYELAGVPGRNRYFLLSGPGSRHLLASPEVIGFPCYTALLDETGAALRHLFPSGPDGAVDILTVLRGGLNYPLEEACFRVGIPVREMHFVSCERVIENHVITGLDIKYEKISPAKGCTLAVGDILATGDTLRYVMQRVVDVFRAQGGSIRRILFFTIGGTRAFSLMDEIAAQLGPGFEGFDCFFYEGLFTVYEDKGVSGINVPDIDFGWKGGAVTPEFRRYVMDRPDALLEKCIIYDGGARRYEIPLHFAEVLEYWEGILARADRIDPLDLVREKLGYDGPVSYPEWQQICHFQELPAEQTEPLWHAEQALLQNLPDLRALAERRIAQINQIKRTYGKT